MMGFVLYVGAYPVPEANGRQLVIVVDEKWQVVGAAAEASLLNWRICVPRMQL